MAPSVCLYTFFHCRRELNTVAIAPNTNPSGSGTSGKNGPIVAAGFADSVIRCWNWNSQKANAASDSTDGQVTEYKSDDICNTLVGHSGPVFALDFSSDSRWLLSSSEDCTARLWNVETGSNVVAYKGHEYAVWDVAFSPIDYLFATASHDRTARVWSTDRVTPLRILAGHLSDVECVKFHPNANYVATGSSDKTVRLWDVREGQCVRMFIGHYGAINTLAFSKDGRYLATAGEDRTIIVWDIATGRIMHEFRGYHKDMIWALDFSFDSSQLVSGSGDCTIRVFDTQSTPTEYGIAKALEGS